MDGKQWLPWLRSLCVSVYSKNGLTLPEGGVRACVWVRECVWVCASIWQRCIPEENVTSSGKNQHAGWCEQMVKEDEEERYEEAGESFISSPKTQFHRTASPQHSYKCVCIVCSRCNSLGTFRVTGGLWLHPGLLPFGVLVIFLIFFMLGGMFILGYGWERIKKGIARTCCCFRMWWRQTRAVFWFLFPKPSFPKVWNSQLMFSLFTTTISTI